MSAINGPQFIYIQYIYIYILFFNQHLSCIMAHSRHHFSILSSVLPNIHSSSCLEVSVHLSGVVWSKLDLQVFASASACSLDGTGPKWTRRGLGCCVGKAKWVSVKVNPAEKNEWAAQQERNPTGSQAYTITHPRTRTHTCARTHGCMALKASLVSSSNAK